MSLCDRALPSSSNPALLVSPHHMVSKLQSLLPQYLPARVKSYLLGGPPPHALSMPTCYPSLWLQCVFLLVLITVRSYICIGSIGLFIAYLSVCIEFSKGRARGV